ncbi:MAG: hypothetical protein RLZ10_1224 [Bacteroidota bacterium]|jgi:hypothetical protein
MKKLILTLVTVALTASAFANGPVFGPAKPPVKQGTGTFKAQSLGYEVKSINDVKAVVIYDNENANGAVQKKLQSFEYQGVEFYTTATLSLNADANKAYGGTSAMIKFGRLAPGLSVDGGITLRGLGLNKELRFDNSYYPTLAIDVEPVTLVRHLTSTPARAEKTFRLAFNKLVRDIDHTL